MFLLEYDCYKNIYYIQLFSKIQFHEKNTNFLKKIRNLVN